MGLTDPIVIILSKLYLINNVKDLFYVFAKLKVTRHSQVGYQCSSLAL